MRCLDYASPEVEILYVAVEDGLLLSSNKGYGNNGEAGSDFDEIDNGEF